MNDKLKWFNKYKYTLDTAHEMPWNMDILHISMLKRAIPKDAIRIIEIGSYRGASTAAFVEALNEGKNFELHLIEPKPQEQLYRLINKCEKRANIVLHKCRSHDVFLQCDMVLIDGSHDWPALHDIARSLAMGTPVIAMHDTRTYLYGQSDCWGAYEAGKILRNCPSRKWQEDCKPRRGMHTHRGFLISTGGKTK